MHASDQPADPVTGLFARPSVRVLILGGGALAVLLFVVLFARPEAFVSRHVGESAYGAFQTTMWNYWYVGEHLADPGALLRSDMQYYPFGVNVYVRIGNLLDIGLYQPFGRLLEDVPARNAFVWFALWLDGMAALWVARRFSGNDGVAIGFALGVGLSRFLLEEMFWGRLTNIFIYPLPLFLLAWHVAALRGGARRALVAGVLLALAGLHYIYFGVFLGGVVLLLAPFHLAKAGARSYLGSLAVLLVVTIVLVAPFAWPFLDPALREGVEAYRVFRWDHLVPPTGDLPPGQEWYWGVVMTHSLSPLEAARRLGPVAVLLLLVSLRDREARSRVAPWLVVAAVAAIFSLGPYLVPAEAERESWSVTVADHPPLRLPAWWLMGRVPFFDRFGHPERFSVVAGLSMMVAACVGIGAWLQGRSRRVGFVTGLVVVALAVGDRLWLDRTQVLHTSPTQHSRFFTEIARDPDPGVLVSLPVQASDFICDHQRLHRWPLLNGYGSMFRIEVVERQRYLDFVESNTVWRHFEDLLSHTSDPELPDPEDWAFFREHDVRYAVLHVDAFRRINTIGEGKLDTEKLRQPSEHTLALSRLTRLLGDSIYHDRSVTVFDLGAVAADPPREWTR